MLKKTFAPLLALALSCTGIDLFAADIKAPETLIYRGEDLLAFRQKMEQDPAAYAPVKKKLIDAAEKALTVPVKTVMDKPAPPDSGDMHDFVSWAIYYWPDPTKPDGKPWKGRDGKANPERLKHTDEAAVMSMFRNSRTLALAGFYTGDQRYYAKAAEFLRAWFVTPETRMNPNVNYGEIRIGVTNGKGSMTGIITFSFRMHMVLDSAILLRGQPCWSNHDEAELRRWLREYLAWCDTHPFARSARKASNNHCTYFYSHLAMIHLYLGEPEKARKELEEVFARRLHTQFEKDGSQPHEMKRTISFTYSTMNLRGWINLAEMGRRCGFDGYGYLASNGMNIQKALAFFAPFADPDYKWQSKQINGKVPWASMWELMVRASQNYDDSAFVKAVDLMQKNNNVGLEIFYFPPMCEAKNTK